MAMVGWVRRGVPAAVWLVLSVLVHPVALQAQVLAKPEGMTPAERAQRDADKVFHWIRLNADKAPTRPAAAAPAAPVRKAQVPSAPPATAPAAVAARAVAVEPPPVVAAAVAVAVESPPPAAAAPAPIVLAVAPQAVPVALPEPPPPAPEPESDMPLKLRVRVEPVISRQLLASMQNGSVQLRFTVQPDGSVHQVEALSASNKRLGVAAVAAVSQWRFEPISRARNATVELGFSQE